MKPVTRRDFIRTTSIVAASLPTLSRVKAQGTRGPGLAPASEGPASAILSWVDGEKPATQAGMAFGVPWGPGVHARDTEFTLRTSGDKEVPLQTWITATWPDGSIKWTGHAVAPESPVADFYEVRAGRPAKPDSPVKLTEHSGTVIVDTGKIRCTLNKGGDTLIASVSNGSGEIMNNGRLVGMRQDNPELGSEVENFTSKVDSLKVEQDGPVRAVVKLDGMHQLSSGRQWLPFSVRLYFHAGSEAIRMVHTFVFDGNEEEDFIRGLGVRFQVPMKDELYNRHVRLAGEGKGVWGEAVQGLTGLRRDPGDAVTEAQVAGLKVPDITTWPATVNTRVHWIPTWGDFSLSQLNANGFSLRKRTKPGHAWINADQGRRANGLAYVGGVSGGLAFGMRDFWKLHPTQLDIRNANTGTAEATVWMWSPDAGPMDIRFYHDGLGQDLTGPVPGVEVEGVELSMPETPYAKQLDALNITYEDYEPGFGTPHGVGRTTDLYLWAFEATPDRETFASLARVVEPPPQLVPQPKHIHQAAVFGTMWDLPDRSSANLSDLEDRQEWMLQYYHDQVEQRHWYGFWDYGDVMHTYDRDRHVWRYDVGGYAWDNSELSTDIWLWMSFLRTGDPKAFRLAEAMNRHNRDVDIYHLGRFAGLGSRHNVMHWGCSAKQLRISTSMNRRFHYFLTTDERTGDVLWEVVEADKQLANINPVRKLPGQPFNVKDCRIGIGTDWGSAVSNWLTAWERTGDTKYRDWIVTSMESIGKAKWGFFTGTFAFDPKTKKMTEPEDPRPNASHLSTMFGLPEVCSELIQLIQLPEFTAAWLQYCRLYNAPEEIQKEKLGPRYRDPGFVVSHSRISAYGAAMEKDPDLAKRAAGELLEREWGPKPELKTQHIAGPDVLNPVDEAAWVSTNDTAQWGLAAMQVAALVPNAVSNY